MTIAALLEHGVSVAALAKKSGPLPQAFTILAPAG